MTKIRVICEIKHFNLGLYVNSCLNCYWNHVRVILNLVIGLFHHSDIIPNRKKYKNQILTYLLPLNYIYFFSAKVLFVFSSHSPDVWQPCEVDLKLKILHTYFIMQRNLENVTWMLLQVLILHKISVWRALNWQVIFGNVSTNSRFKNQRQLLRALLNMKNIILRILAHRIIS